MFVSIRTNCNRFLFPNTSRRASRVSDEGQEPIATALAIVDGSTVDVTRFLVHAGRAGVVRIDVTTMCPAVVGVIVTTDRSIPLRTTLP